MNLRQPLLHVTVRFPCSQIDCSVHLCLLSEGRRRWYNYWRKLSDTSIRSSFTLLTLHRVPSSGYTPSQSAVWTEAQMILTVLLPAIHARCRRLPFPMPPPTGNDSRCKHFPCTCRRYWLHLADPVVKSCDGRLPGYWRCRLLISANTQKPFVACQPNFAHTMFAYIQPLVNQIAQGIAMVWLSDNRSNLWVSTKLHCPHVSNENQRSPNGAVIHVAYTSVT
jgi:hypothetical protein